MDGEIRKLSYNVMADKPLYKMLKEIVMEGRFENKKFHVENSWSTKR
jgi:hypothetical protein